VRRVFDQKLEPKVINNREITASELLAFFQVYVRLFNGDESGKGFPKVS
jgi:hypothetical protein